MVPMVSWQVLHRIFIIIKTKQIKVTHTYTKYYEIHLYEFFKRGDRERTERERERDYFS